MTVTHQNSNAILFVDDEEKALKMFTRLVSPHFEVLTAADAKGARQILEQHHEKIGVLITDQRMPGEFGVDLLRHVRKEYPRIIRLLTTAYSDLEDAIAAVNTGEIFRYINKPWNADELLIDLRLAMNFFVLEKDRLQLINEKMSLSHRQSRMEMMKSLITMSSAQTHFNHPALAIKSFLEQIAEPQKDIESSINPGTSGYWENEIHKTEKMIQINRSLSQWADKIRSHIGDRNADIDYEACVQQINKELSINIQMDLSDDLPSQVLDQQGFTALLKVVFQILATDDNGYHDISCNINKTENSIVITSQTPAPNNWLAEQLLTQGDNDAEQKIGELLAIFVLVYHLGGSIKLDFDGSLLADIQVKLPTTTDNSAASDDLEGNIWIEDLFVLYN